MDAVRLMGDIIKETAQLTQENNSIGCAKLVVFANAVQDNPFMAGAFHGPGEPEYAVSVGVSGPGVVKAALEKVKGADFDTVSETIKRTAGGNLRKIVGGERLKLKLKMRLTPAQYRSVITLLTNNANNYFYTPEESTASYWSDLYPSLSFPVNITYTDLDKEWDNRKHWYVNLDAEVTNYV